VRILIRREEELVDVAPHWGEPHISCVMVLCAMFFVLLCIYMLSALFLMYDR
jgi:hypothetical protein